MASHFCPFSTDNVPPDPSSSANPEHPNESIYPRHVFDDISEKQLEPRPRTLSFYFVLFFAVIPVWSVIPLSWAFVAYALYTRGFQESDWGWRALLALASCEVRPFVRLFVS